MGVGHAAVALGTSKFAPRINVGWLVFAALLADFLLGIFATMGLEHATAPPDFAVRHYFWFTFPYSHGLLALTIWATVAGFLISRLRTTDRGIVFAAIFVLVLSHFVLDALVHVAGLPLAGENSFKVGLGLWKRLPMELSLETLMAVVGIVIFVRGAGADCPAVSRYGVPLLVAFLAAMTWTQLSLVTAPGPRQLATGWIVAPLVLSGAAYAMDYGRTARAKNE